MVIRYGMAILGLLFLPIRDVEAAREAVYGLERVKIVNVFDPNARPERLLLVSGSLKLTGGFPGGNVWEVVSYIPQRTAAPKSDYGIFHVVGNRLVFYSFQTLSTYLGTIEENGEQIEIQKVSREGRAQTEVWYLVR